MENIFSPSVKDSKTDGKIINLITDEYILDVKGENMSSNKKIFKAFQREANLGKTKHVKILDKQVMTHLVKYDKKDKYDTNKHYFLRFHPNLSIISKSIN